MATDIVSGLFGINPTQYQQAQQAREFSQDYQMAQLTPLQQSEMAIRQGARTFGRGVGSLMGLEDAELAKVSQIKQLASQFDLSSPEGLRQFSAALQPFAPEEAIRAAQVADEREKSGLGLRETKAKIEKAELSAAQEEKLRAELSALPANASEQQVIEVVRKYGSPDKILQVLTDSQNRAATRAAAAANKAAAQGPLGPLTPAEKVVDQKFGVEYNNYVNGGGINTVEKNLKLLDDAIKIIKDSPEGDISGKTVGLSDKAGTLSYTHPKAAEAKDLIGGVAQSNLRQVLGGQFAAKEGEQLLARAYNPAQPKKDNLNRLIALREQIANSGKAKADAALYYQEYGTLKGFKGISSGGATPPAETTTTEKKKTTRKLKSGIEVTIEE